MKKMAWILTALAVTGTAVTLLAYHLNKKKKEKEEAEALMKDAETILEEIED